MPDTPKVLFLGLDAVDHNVLERLAAAGDLPVLRRLLGCGLLARTRSVPWFFSQSTWPSFYTGVGPAEHSVHGWLQLRPGSYELYRTMTGDRVQARPFWERLSRAGKRVAVLDVPLSPLSPHLNGLQVFEWGAHDWTHGFRTSPPALATELAARFGRYPFSVNCNAHRSPAEIRAFSETLVAAVRQKVAITRHMLARERWDFFAQVFTESHCAGHQCWHLHDPGYSRYSDADRAIAGDPLYDVYRAIDTGLGEILAEIDERTMVIVLATHGMGAKNGAQHLLEDILIRLGYAVPPPPAALSFGARMRHGLEAGMAAGWRLLPGAAKSLLRPLRAEVYGMVHVDDDAPSDRIDRAASRCFILQIGSSHGAIRLNLAGREPAGLIRAGAEEESVIRELTDDILAIVNADTGRRIATRVLRTKSLFDGPRTAHFPDLVVEWSQAAPVRAVESARLGRIEKPYTFNRTGEHSAAGLMMARGPGIRPRRIERTVSIMDFAPTFCALLGVADGGFEGSSIPEIVVRAGHKVRRAEPVHA